MFSIVNTSNCILFAEKLNANFTITFQTVIQRALASAKNLLFKQLSK
jgi:hypothetical protein